MGSERTEAGRRGMRIDSDDPSDLAAAVRAVVDYRGDVTITRRSDGGQVSGYVFDCREGDDPERAALRLLPAAGGTAETVPLRDVAVLEFTGRDTAEGRSFETWVRRYAEEKLGVRIEEER